MSYRITQAGRNISNFLTFHAEATPDGVNIMYRSNNGMTEHVETVSYIDAINRLDARGYGDKPGGGMFVHPAVANGGNQGHFDYISQHHMIMQCWPIATVLINEARKESGTVSIIDDSDNHSVVSVHSNGIVAMPLYPAAERLAMASNIEGAMIEKCGVDVGTKNAIIFYSNVFDVEQGTFTLFGREVLADLHSNFIAESNENGVSEAPVMH